MKSTFEKLKQLIIKYQDDIILFIGVILISLLSFAAGYIVAKQKEKEPIRIEYINHTPYSLLWKKFQII
jgi:hypothetical protein